MRKERLYRLIIATVAVFGGIIIDKSCGHTTTMMVMDSGKVYPAPHEGDTLEFIDERYNPIPVKWDPSGSGSSFVPCTNLSSDLTSNTCDVKFRTAKLRLYHYSCDTCIDPDVPGRQSNGSKLDRLLTNLGLKRRPAKSAAAPPPKIANHLIAQVQFNSEVTVVTYYPFNNPSGLPGAPIPVTNYGPNPTQYDQVYWEPVGIDGWQVILPAGTCQESPQGSPAIFPANDRSLCTVIATSSRTYCAVYPGKAAVKALLAVNGNTTPDPSIPVPELCK